MERLLFGKDYHCWREGRYIGIATYKNDKNIGSSFIRLAVNPNGKLEKKVLTPEKIDAAAINNFKQLLASKNLSPLPSETQTQEELLKELAQFIVLFSDDAEPIIGGKALEQFTIIRKGDQPNK